MKVTPVTLFFMVVIASVGHAYEHGVHPAPIHSAEKQLVTPVFAESDTFALVQLAEFEFSFLQMAFGDTDHDGAYELAFTGASNTFRIWENQGSNTYTLVANGPSAAFVFVLADLDQDGLSEIICQNSGYIKVFESTSPSTHPSELVWSSPYLSNVIGHTAVGDTDRDGRMELIHSVNGNGQTSGLVIFENTGDNQFDLVFDATLTGPSSTGAKAIADFDGDGRVEIALCGSPGWLHVFESPADNTWELVFRENTRLWNAYGLVGGKDTDKNGKSELFVNGDTEDMVTTLVYESSGNNVFACIDKLVTGPGLGPRSADIGDVDMDGRDEYLIHSGGIRVFRANLPGKWDLVGTAYGPGGGVHVFDLNKNGIPEVVWQFQTTRIFEHPIAITDAPFPLKPPVLAMAPNPGLDRVALTLPEGRARPRRLAIFDMRGRLVESSEIKTASRTLMWEPALPAGTYLLRLEDSTGHVLASGKGTLIR